jgi:drug/metabolite transporter (DMT)-like permease
MRIVAVPCMVGLALAVGVRAPTRRMLGLLVVVGVADTGATLLYAAASTRGLLSVVAVLSSLYPVVIVALARVVLHERVARAQLVGVAVALTGVALISAG